MDIEDAVYSLAWADSTEDGLLRPLGTHTGYEMLAQIAQRAVLGSQELAEIGQWASR